MKVLVLGKHRSRSNWFLDNICTHYELKNLYEPYRPIYDKHLLPLENPWWTSPELKVTPADFINDIKNVTYQLEDKDNYAIKLEVTHLTMFPYAGQLVEFDWFNWKMFDKIYITTRKNIIDTICSLTVAHVFNKWLYTENNKPLDTIDSFNFNPTLPPHQKALFTALWDDHVLDLVYDHLKANHIQFSTIAYEDMIDYVKKNLSNGQSQYLSGEYNYKQIISNYSDMITHINSMRPNVMRLFEAKNY